MRPRLVTNAGPQVNVFKGETQVEVPVILLKPPFPRAMGRIILAAYSGGSEP